MRYLKRTKTMILLLPCLMAAATELKAQITDSAVLHLSMSDVIQYAKESNMLVKAFNSEVSASQADLEDAKMGILPRVFSSASYQRYSKVTLFDHVIGASHQIPKPPDPNAGALGIQADYNLFSDGRKKSMVMGFKLKSDIAVIKSDEQKANISLQAVAQYLNMIRLYYQQNLIRDQEERAQTRLKNINAFYTNGKVTKSDVLRAEVALSNVELNLTANRNDYQISSQKLKALLNLDSSSKIVPEDTSRLILPEFGEVEGLLNDASQSFQISEVQKKIELQENLIKITKSFNLPTLDLMGGYGFNYPTTLVFPPLPQTFGVGFLGVKITYNISSLYQNKNKIRAANLRANEMRQQKDWIEDNVSQEVEAFVTKYKEAVERMSVVQKQIEQAQANYKIENAKYFNQLTLLTDLLEADNLYYESQVNYIQANIGALSIYYQLLFLTGKI